jgi:hypothetical protein
VENNLLKEPNGEKEVGKGKNLAKLGACETIMLIFEH